MIGLGLSPAADRSAHALRLSWVLMAGLMGATVLALGLGAASVSLPRVLADLLAGRGVAPQDHLVLMQIRLPRLIMGGLIGAALGVSGALMQGLFRNPLADPGLVGVSSGAALAAGITIVLGDLLIGARAGNLPFALLPFGAFLGGLASTFLLYGIATRRGRTSIATMLLAGIALGALSGAMSGFLSFLSDDRQLRDLTFWALGSFAGASWTKVSAVAPVVLVLASGAPFLARGLNALAIGEAEAYHLGFRVQAIKAASIVLVALAVGVSVAAAGVIGFVGIVVPHLVRLGLGADHRTLLPLSAMGGAVLLMAADLVARSVVAPAELPIGIVTAAMGAPFFLWLLLRRETGIE